MGYLSKPTLNANLNLLEPTEAKSVCEGTFGVCCYLEIQKGKVRMARKKWREKYKANCACTVRLIDKMGLR